MFTSKFIRSFLILLLAFPSVALATRIETIRWTHSAVEDTDGFRLHLGTRSGNYTATQDLGKPPATNGVFSFNLTVPKTETLYVALTAYGEGFLESLPSNEKVLFGEAPPPPPLGGTWNENFESLALGSSIPNWLPTGPNNSLIRDDTIFRIENFSGNQVLATSATSTNFHAHYVGAGSKLWNEYELAGRFLSPADTGSIGVTVYSQYPDEDGYYRLRSWQNGNFELSPHGTVAACASPSLGVAPVRNQWTRFRIQVSRVGNSNEIRAKIWEEGTPEPGWQATCLDPNPVYTAGTIGVWGGRAGTKYWDDLEVISLSPEPVFLPAPILLPAP